MIISSKTKEWFEMVERLRYADAIWTEDEQPVEIIQTHISVILLGKSLVLKLKKPVNFGFLDYGTLAKRRFACEREVELNRRLCPDIYLGTKRIIKDKRGIFRLDGEGETIEYGVLMKRLPRERMLDQMIADDTVTEVMISQIADKLCRFHQRARRGADVDAFGSPQTVRFNWEENFEQTAPFIERTISKSDYELIKSRVYRWLADNENLLLERVAKRRICDGHGDVRCESIAVTNDICIFDCIEFNERFRCADVANEAAFLAMDLDAYGRPDLGYFFFESYAEKADDTQIFELYSFYRCYRAFVRGKVLSFQLDEAELSEENHKIAGQRAKNYFKIAASSARPVRTPVIILVAGLSGTGKTSVARSIAGQLGWRVVSSDAVRQRIFGGEKKSSDYGKGKYDEESNRLTYEKMFETGIELCWKNGGVILDATFSRAADREKIRQIAESIGAECPIIECRLSPEAVRRRLELRAQKKDGLSDATWNIFLRQQTDFEPFETDDDRHLILDTGKNLSENSSFAAEWLRRKR